MTLRSTDSLFHGQILAFLPETTCRMAERDRAVLRFGVERRGKGEEWRGDRGNSKTNLRCISTPSRSR